MTNRDDQRNAAMFLLVGLEAHYKETGMLIDPHIQEMFDLAKKRYNREIPSHNRKYGIERAKELAGDMHRKLARQIKKSLRGE